MFEVVVETVVAEQLKVFLGVSAVISSKDQIDFFLEIVQNDVVFNFAGIF